MSASMFRNLTAGLLAACLGFAAASLVSVTATPAAAQTAAEKAAVDAAKARGQVGEQGDGYLGFVTPSTDPMLAAAVAAINSGRMQVYPDTAMRHRAPRGARGP